MSVVLENATIEALAARPDAVAALPQILKDFGTLKSAVSGCNCDRAKRQQAQLYERVKLAMVALGEEDRQKLRGLLKTDKVIVYVLRDGRNGTKYEL